MQVTQKGLTNCFLSAIEDVRKQWNYVFPFSKGNYFQLRMLHPSQLQTSMKVQLSFREDSESLFPTYPCKELISGYIPVKGWNKSGQCKWILWETQDPKNSDSNPGEE